MDLAALGRWRDRLVGQLVSLRIRLEVHALFRIAERVVVGYQRNRIPDDAAALTYYGIFSLFPLLLLFMSLVGLVLQNNDVARQRILDAVTDLLPQGQDSVRAVITSVVEARGTAAGVGLLTLVWGALGWLQVLDDNTNRMWGATAGHSFVAGKLRALAMVGGIGAVALASWIGTIAIDAVATLLDDIPGGIVLWQLAVSLLTFVTMAALFFLLYRVTPRAQLHGADVWPAALAAAVAWELTRRGLDLYLQQTNMVSGYGPIGALMALLFWIYVVSMIILLGAQLTHAIVMERRAELVDPDVARARES